jgi:RecA-family ATPase
MRNVRWLWENRIPLGMLSGLYGVEGMGKSLETVRIAAAVTRGDLPGALEGEPRRVLIATTEDGWRETIAPRLKAAGADMSMVGHWRITENGSDEAPELPRDADILAEDARGNNVGLVILDPVVSHLDGRADSHKAKDVRKALEPLHRVAEIEGFAVLGIMHLNKEKGSDSRQRGQGSTAFREVFRSTLVFGPDPDAPQDKSARVVALDKNNLVPPQPAYRMQIESVTLEDADPDTGEPIRTARILLGEEASYTAEDVLEAAATGKARGLSEKADRARLFLRERLAAGGGVTPTKETEAAAEAEGISATALRKAREDLKLKSRRVPGAEGTVWELYDPAEAGERLDP